MPATETKTRRSKKDFDITMAPRVKIEYDNPSWCVVQSLDDSLPNLPMPTYQSGRRIVVQHTADNVSFLCKYNQVQNQEEINRRWVPYYKQYDNVDRYDLMCQCKAYETQILPELKSRMRAAGLDTWDWLYSHQTVAAYLGSLNNSYGLLLDMGTGKDQPLDALVYTEHGPKRMGDMRIGDKVCTPDGATAFVDGIYPQGLRPVFRIEFNDKTSVLCGQDHLWAVQTPVMKKRNKGFVVKTTQELSTDLLSGPNLKWFVPMTKPLAFTKKDLPLEPYLLGVLLGDGGLSCGVVSITKDNPLLFNLVRTKLPQGHVLVQDSNSETNLHYRITSVDKKNNAVLNSIRKLGLNKKSIDKHIPTEYLHASVEQRIALLQGLMDTYGTNTKNNRSGEFTGAAYSTSSKQLSDDFCFLIQSLGGIARVSIKKAPTYTHNGERRIGQPNYVIDVNLPADILPFAVDPKKSRYVPNTKYLPARGITNIEFIGMQYTQCIHVNHPEHLYVTNNATVTHNTVTALQIAHNRLLRQETMHVLLVIPASLHNTWDKELRSVKERTGNPHFELVQLSGSAEERRYQLKHCRGPFFSVNYEMLNTLMPELAAKQFNMIIYDESSKIKSPSAKMTLASWSISQQAKYKLILNGSPYSKSLADIHSQLNALQVGSLYRPLPTDPYAFANKYLEQKGFKQVPKNGAVAAVNRALYSYSIRYTSEECLDLPERTIQNVFCDMTPKQWEVYREVEAQTFTEVCDRAVKATDRLSKLAKVFQITSGFVNDVNGKSVLFEPKAPKLEALREMLAATDRSIIVFAWHTFLLEMLHEEYKDESVLYHGGVTNHDKTRAEKMFQAGEKRIFFGQESAAARGLNLQIAPYSIFVERNHSLDNYVQALKRNHRNGQINRCFAYNLMVPNTVDTDIDASILGKAEDSEEALMTIARNMGQRLGYR